MRIHGRLADIRRRLETGTMDSRNAAKAVIKEVPQKFEIGHMNAHELLQSLTETHPNRMEQLTGPLGKTADSVQGLIDQLSDLHCDMAIANGKCGYVGNPYEKLEVDCAILLGASEKITGLRSRFPWQRT